MNKKLTAKQIRFCEEYIIDLNATQAAIRAGYSKKVAGSIGFENLRKPEIESFISSLQKDKSEELNFSFERVALEIAKVAYGDVKNFFDKDGQLININKLEDHVSASIKSVTVFSEKTTIENDVKVQESIKKIESYDKLKALELLGKMFGHFSKDNEQKKPDSVVTIFELPNNNRK